MPYGPDDIGAFLLESITTGLYRQPLNAIREYIQNEIDADPQPDYIDILVKKEARKMAIIGDGAGMDQKELFLAKKVGISNKNRKQHAGFRGIGIWAGVSVCREMRVTTKKKESRKFLVLRVNCDGLRKDVKEGTKTLIQALKDHVSYGEFDAPQKFVNKRGTHVELNGILPEAETLLDKNEVRRYVSQTAPVPISPDCSLHDDIEKLLQDNVAGYQTFKIRVEGKEVYRPPTLKKSDLDLMGPYEFAFTDDGGHVKGFAWVCQNREPRVISSDDNKRIVFKAKGITIGDRDAILRYVHRARPLLDRTVGEVHVLDEDIIPNTERSDFEANPARDELEAWIRDLVYKQIKKKTREHSATENYKEHTHAAEDLLAVDLKSLKDESAWSTHIEQLTRTSRELKNDARNFYLKASATTKAARLAARLDAHVSKVMKAYRGLEKKAAQPEEPPSPAKTEEDEAAARESAEDEEEAEGEDIVEVSPDAELLGRVSPLLEGLGSRAELEEDETALLECVLRVLASDPMATYEGIHTFLARLELELARR